MAENIDAERELKMEAALAAVKAHPTPDTPHTSVKMRAEEDRAAFMAGYLAARSTPSPSIGEDGLPKLPNAAHRGPDGTGSYFDSYTADQMREFARDAVAADRRRPKREMPPELKTAIEEAHKTRATGALLPDGSAVFINYGDQPEDAADLACTACGGSGHIDDQRAIAVSGASSPQTAQGVKTLPEGLLDELNDAVIEALNQAAAIKDWGARDHWQEVLNQFDAWRTAPPLSSEQQADRVVRLLREARATLEMWKDVAPAVSLCADIDKALAGEPQAKPACRNCLDFGWEPSVGGPRRPCGFCQKAASEQQAEKGEGA